MICYSRAIAHLLHAEKIDAFLIQMREVFAVEDANQTQGC